MPESSTDEHQKAMEDAAEQAGASLNENLAQSVRDDQAAAKTNARIAGCGPATLVIIGAVIAVVVGLVVVIFGNSGGISSSSPNPSSLGAVATSSSSEAAIPPADSLSPPVAPTDSTASIAPSLANFDGTWALLSGLRNTLTDMPAQCNACDAYTVTVDDPQASIDISGTQITGGQYKTGYSATLAGDQCPVEQQSRIDATVSGGVDLNLDYGTLVIDGTATSSVGCDANYRPNVQTGPDHTSRLFYIKDDTLYLCQGLNATFTACIAPNGGAADPVATFQR